MPGFLAAAIPSLLSAGAGLLNSHLSRRQQRQNVERQNEHNLELAEYQYSKDLEMWNRQNQYNTPEMQMQRLKTAGLNPNLVYGKGTVTGNTSSQLPKYNAPTTDYSGIKALEIPNMIGMYQDIALKNAQIDNVKQTIQEREIRNDVALASSKWDKLARKNKGKSAFVDWANKNLQGDVLRRQSSLLDKQLTERDYDILYKKYRNQWMSQGMTSKDNIGFRMLVRMLAESGIDIQTLLGK